MKLFIFSTFFISYLAYGKTFRFPVQCTKFSHTADYKIEKIDLLVPIIVTHIDSEKKSLVEISTDFLSFVIKKNLPLDCWDKIVQVYGSIPTNEGYKRIEITILRNISSLSDFRILDWDTSLPTQNSEDNKDLNELFQQLERNQIDKRHYSRQFFEFLKAKLKSITDTKYQNRLAKNYLIGSGIFRITSKTEDRRFDAILSELSKYTSEIGFGKQKNPIISKTESCEFNQGDIRYYNNLKITRSTEKEFEVDLTLDFQIQVQEDHIQNCLEIYRDSIITQNDFKLKVYLNRDSNLKSNGFISEPQDEAFRGEKYTFGTKSSCNLVMHEIFHHLGLVDTYRENANGYIYSEKSTTFEYKDVIDGSGSLEYRCRNIGGKSIMNEHDEIFTCNQYVAKTNCIESDLKIIDLSKISLKFIAKNYEKEDSFPINEKCEINRIGMYIINCPLDGKIKIVGNEIVEYSNSETQTLSQIEFNYIVYPNCLHKAWIYNKCTATAYLKTPPGFVCPPVNKLCYTGWTNFEQKYGISHEENQNRESGGEK